MNNLPKKIYIATSDKCLYLPASNEFQYETYDIINGEFGDIFLKQLSYNDFIDFIEFIATLNESIEIESDSKRYIPRIYQNEFKYFTW